MERLRRVRKHMGTYTKLPRRQRRQVTSADRLGNGHSTCQRSRTSKHGHRSNDAGAWRPCTSKPVSSEDLAESKEGEDVTPRVPSQGWPSDIHNAWNRETL